jgi:hypothetical protein
LVLAAFLYLNPTLTSTLTSNLGAVGTETAYDRTRVVSIAPQNYSYVDAKLAPGDSLAVSLTSNPGNIDVLIMNQGNFSLWSQGGRGSYSTYPQSLLHVSNYSFVFKNEEASQTFFVVLVSHSSSQETETLVHAVVTRPSQLAPLLFPLLFCLVGAAVLGLAARGGRKASGKPDSKHPAVRSPSAEPTHASTAVPRCRHCGATLVPGSAFCPSCGRSQT